MIRPSPRFWIVVFSTIAVVVPGVACIASGGGYWAWPIVSGAFIVVSAWTVKWAAKMTRPPDRR